MFGFKCQTGGGNALLNTPDYKIASQTSLTQYGTAQWKRGISWSRCQKATTRYHTLKTGGPFKQCGVYSFDKTQPYKTHSRRFRGKTLYSSDYLFLTVNSATKKADIVCISLRKKILPLIRTFSDSWHNALLQKISACCAKLSFVLITRYISVSGAFIHW